MKQEEVAGYKDMCEDLSGQLSQKEGEIQELRKGNFELKKRIAELESELEMVSPALAKSRSKSSGIGQEQNLKQVLE